MAEMAITDRLCDSWDSITPDERLRELTDTINETLADLGYDPVKVELADLVGAYGDYDSATDTVRLDQGHVTNGDFESVLNTAYHEAAHAIEDQDDYDASLTPEQEESYNGERMLFVEDGEDWIEWSEIPHGEVEQFAEYEVELAKERCAELSTESASSAPEMEFTLDDLDALDADADGGDELDIEMGEPIVRDETDEEWFTIGEPTVTDASDGDAPSNLETPPGPGTAGSGP